MKLFFLVLARDKIHVDEKVKELERLGVPYLIICGERLNHPNVIYREPKGKYDAINFGASFIPKDVEIVALNDVDTKIYNLQDALEHFDSKNVALVFAKVSVKEGPQIFFNAIQNVIRRRLLINANGDLMLIRRYILERILPLIPCKAEDSYILFKILEFKQRVVFCEKCFVETDKTKIAAEEANRKRRTVCGIYQALANTKGSNLVRLFYTFLPFASPLLLVLGKKGYFGMKGILLGLTDYLRGDQSGFWQSN